MGKTYTDYQRLELVKQFKLSKTSVTDFAIKHGIARSTLRDWIYAFEDINGGFINVNSIRIFSIIK